MTTGLNSQYLELGPANVYIEESGQDVNIGYLAEGLEYHATVTAAELTGAQKGTSPLDKIITGGRVWIVVPFKEITLTNLARAFPGCVLTADKTRVDFKNRVGLSMRSLAKKMTIKKIIGGVESALKSDQIIIPEASPADTELNIPFGPTAQRVITATFEAWPDDTTGRYAYAGDELGS